MRPVRVDQVIVDGLNLTERAGKALGRGALTTRAGLPTETLYVALKTLASLRKRFPGSQLWVAWDSPNPSRKTEFPGYKAHRHPPPPDGKDSGGWASWNQVRWLKDALPWFGVRQVSSDGEEADDVIASILSYDANPAMVESTRIILSSDRDLLQLVSSTVSLLVPKQQGSPETLYDPAAVRREYGVGPDRIVTLRAFAGDASDELDGVARVQRKFLASLVQEFQTLDAIYAAPMDRWTKIRRENIKRAEARVRRNLAAMTLRWVPVTQTYTMPSPSAARDVLRMVDVRPETVPLDAFFDEVKPKDDGPLFATASIPISIPGTT